MECPKILPDRVASPGIAGLARVLVPVAATRLDVCRYGPFAPAGGPLTVTRHFTLVDRVTVVGFERAVNTLPELSPGLVPNCPNDDGHALVVRFSDAAHAVTLRVALSGCGFVTNGTRTARPSASWNDAAARLEVAGCPGGPPVFAQPALANDPRGRVMVPVSAVGVLVCRYAGSNGENRDRLDAFGVANTLAKVRALEAQANGMRRVSPTERVPCPLDPNAPSWFVTFTDGSSSVDLLQTASNCGYVSNGVLTGVPAPAWRAALVPLVGPR